MTALPAFLTAPAGSPLPLPRLLVVFAHPDDEVLALGARLERLSASRLLCVTDGAPTDGADMAAHGFPTRAAYRDARRAELNQALALAGLPAGCADTLRLQTSDTDTFLDVQSADSPGAPVADQACAFHLAGIARALRREIDAFQPDAVLTHPYEGGHPDHDSCAFAVQAALNLPGRSHPLMIEAPSYHSRAAWSPGGQGIVTNAFLPQPAPQTPVTRYDVTPAEQIRKRERLACFTSQTETLRQFSTACELFRPAPTYDFTQPPHAGPLFYDHFSWGVTSSRFRELVRLAMLDLGRR